MIKSYEELKHPVCFFCDKKKYVVDNDSIGCSKSTEENT